MMINSAKFAPVVPGLTPKEAYQKILGGAVLVDVRTPDEIKSLAYNVTPIIAFGEPAHLAETRFDEYETHTRKLRAMLRDGLLERIPDIQINGHPEKVLPNTLNISFPRVEGKSILLMLNLAGISVSTGSACASGSLDPSHVLVATGVTPEIAHGSIRFSLGMDTTVEEIERVLDIVPDVIKRLRSYSTIA